MTFVEAIQKTKDDKRKTTEHYAKYWLMRRIYRKVCKKIYCDYCPVCNTCHFMDAIGRGISFRDAVELYMRDKDIVTVLRWSRDEASNERGQDD